MHLIILWTEYWYIYRLYTLILSRLIDSNCFHISTKYHLEQWVLVVELEQRYCLPAKYENSLTPVSPFPYLSLVRRTGLSPSRRVAPLLHPVLLSFPGADNTLQSFMPVGRNPEWNKRAASQPYLKTL